MHLYMNCCFFCLRRSLGDTVQWEIAGKGHYRAMYEISLKVIFFILFNTVLYFSSGEVKKNLPDWIEGTGKEGTITDSVSGAV